ncbi:TIGR03546 family protein [Colwellia sp. MEBiC06753]
MLSILAKLLKALNSESSTRQIAAAVALAFIFALSPLVSLQAIVLLFIVLLVRVNLSAFIVAATLFKGLAIIISPITVNVGEWLLTSNATSGLMASLYQFDWFKLAQWHHTYNSGALLLGLVLALPIYWLTKTLVEKYRVNIKAYFEQLAVVKALKATRIFQLYQQLPSAGDR